MTAGYFTNHAHPPSPEEIRLALGSLYSLWERLTRFIEANYRIEGEWSFWGPAKSGWNLRFRRRGKALVALYPQKERVTAQVVLESTGGTGTEPEVGREGKQDVE